MRYDIYSLNVHERARSSCGRPGVAGAPTEPAGETEPPTYRLGVRPNFASHVITSYQILHVFKVFGWSK